MATKKEMHRIMRQTCSECMGGPRACENVWPAPNPADIKNCTSVKCGLYRFRMGSDAEHEPDPGKQAMARERFGHLSVQKQEENSQGIDDLVH